MVAPHPTAKSTAFSVSLLVCLPCLVSGISAHSLAGALSEAFHRRASLVRRQGEDKDTAMISGDMFLDSDTEEASSSLPADVYGHQTSGGGPGHKSSGGGTDAHKTDVISANESMNNTYYDDPVEAEIEDGLFDPFESDNSSHPMQQTHVHIFEYNGTQTPDPQLAAELKAMQDLEAGKKVHQPTMEELTASLKLKGVNDDAAATVEDAPSVCKETSELQGIEVSENTTELDGKKVDVIKKVSVNWITGGVNKSFHPDCLKELSPPDHGFAHGKLRSCATAVVKDGECAKSFQMYTNFTCYCVLKYPGGEILDRGGTCPLPNRWEGGSCLYQVSIEFPDGEDEELNEDDEGSEQKNDW